MKLLWLLKAYGWRVEYLTEDAVYVYHPEHPEYPTTYYYLDELKAFDGEVVKLIEG